MKLSSKKRSRFNGEIKPQPVLWLFSLIIKTSNTFVPFNYEL